jgi:hypothetical protein
VKKDCSDCIHSTAGEYPKCRHPNNLRADLFGEYPVFRLAASHREFGGEDEARMPTIRGKSGRWFDDGESDGVTNAVFHRAAPAI